MTDYLLTSMAIDFRDHYRVLGDKAIEKEWGDPRTRAGQKTVLDNYFLPRFLSPLQIIITEVHGEPP